VCRAGKEVIVGVGEGTAVAVNAGKAIAVGDETGDRVAGEQPPIRQMTIKTKRMGFVIATLF
jgi:prefoldin subunit 5